MRSSARSSDSDSKDTAPAPERGLARWKAGLAKILRKDPDVRWGGQLLRIASDMIVICDENLEICHHNRAFLKAIGHTSGTFAGVSFTEFFPIEERGGVIEAFNHWRQGHAAGMRFQAPLLTTRGGRACDFRVVRSKDRHGAFYYYMVARDANEGRRGNHVEEASVAEPFFKGLPVAAWRTDAALRITHVYGNLWPELGAASEDLVGEVFGSRHDSLLPPVLLGIDCSDTLTGMSLQTEVCREGERFNVTVEPFIDVSGQVVGTVGMLRRALASDFESPSFRSMSSNLRNRHHAPPETPHGGISIMTGRVPKFVEDSDDNKPLIPEAEPIIRSRGLRLGRS